MISAGNGSFTVSGTPLVRRDAIINSDAMSGVESPHPNGTEKWGDNIRLELSIDDWIAGFDRTHFKLDHERDDELIYNYATFQCPRRAEPLGFRPFAGPQP